jgi:hypothetical protein
MSQRVEPRILRMRDAGIDENRVERPAHLRAVALLHLDPRHRSQVGASLVGQRLVDLHRNHAP